MCSIPEVWVKEDSDTVIVFGSIGRNAGHRKEKNWCPAIHLASAGQPTFCQYPAS
jgi:hypothetical protein